MIDLAPHFAAGLALTGGAWCMLKTSEELCRHRLTLGEFATAWIAMVAVPFAVWELFWVVACGGSMKDAAQFSAAVIPVVALCILRVIARAAGWDVRWQNWRARR